LDYNQQMDDLESLLNKNDEILGEIRHSLKEDFMAKIDLLDE